MATSEQKLQEKLMRIRTDLRYYQQMTPEQYITERVIQKIKLYFMLSIRNKFWYNAIAVSTVFAGIAVPIILSADFPYAKQIATAFTLLAGGLLSLEAAVFTCREKFRNYKKSEDQLTYELMLYQTGSEPYHLASNESVATYRLFVSRVESVILRERDDTVEKMTQKSLETIKVPN